MQTAGCQNATWQTLRTRTFTDEGFCARRMPHQALVYSILLGLLNDSGMHGGFGFATFSVGHAAHAL